MKKILVIYGGNSYEHEISCMSANNVCECLKKLNYEFDKIYISKENKWYLINDNNKVEILNIIEFLKRYSIVFPVMHGAFGEDGRLQSFFELFNINYIGSNSSSSMISMNKFLTKLLIEKTSIKQIPYFVMKKGDKIPKNIEYPVIIKPANGGSSIGISVAKNIKDFKTSLKEGFKYDDCVIVEKFINGIDLECGIVKYNNKFLVGDVGEINHSHEFYDYDAKYKEKSDIIIPARLDKKIINDIKKKSLEIFKTLNLSDFARIDFIYDINTKAIYFNEVNTIPGFTDISMFPLLFKSRNLDFTKLLNEIIKNKKVL